MKAPRKKPSAGIKTDFITGYNKAGLVTHWPRAGFVARDGKVYNTQTDEFMGVEDADAAASVPLTDPIKSAVAETIANLNADVADRSAAVPPAPQSIKENEMNNASNTNASANAQDQATNNPTSGVEDAKVKAAQPADAAPAAGPSTSTPKEETVNNTHTNTSAAQATPKTAVKTDTPFKSLTRWGFAWRMAVLLAIVAAAVVAVAFGVQFGLGYAATLGLSEMVMLVITVVTYLATLAAVIGIGYLGTKQATGLVARRCATNFEQAFQEAAAAA